MLIQATSWEIKNGGEVDTTLTCPQHQTGIITKIQQQQKILNNQRLA